MIYSDKVMDHFKNPRNMGNIENPDGVGSVGNIVCGDIMHLYIKVEQNSDSIDFIKDIKYEALGCVAAISTSSIITELVKGKTLDEAIKIDKNIITDSLGGLPKVKFHCSILAADALISAIYDYLSKNGKNISDSLEAMHNKIAKQKCAFNEKHIH